MTITTPCRTVHSAARTRLATADSNRTRRASRPVDQLRSSSPGRRSAYVRRLFTAGGITTATRGTGVGTHPASTVRESCTTRGGPWSASRRHRARAASSSGAARPSRACPLQSRRRATRGWKPRASSSSATAARSSCRSRSASPASVTSECCQGAPRTIGSSRARQLGRELADGRRELQRRQAVRKTYVCGFPRSGPPAPPCIRSRIRRDPMRSIWPTSCDPS